MGDRIYFAVALESLGWLSWQLTELVVVIDGQWEERLHFPDCPLLWLQLQECSTSLATEDEKVTPFSCGYRWTSFEHIYM